MRRLVTPSWYAHNWKDVVVLAGVLIVLAGTVDNSLSGRRVAQQVKKAICTLRAERLEAIHVGERFLQEHPNGSGDITRADIVASLKLQRETVHAFSYAHCKVVAPSSR